MEPDLMMRCHDKTPAATRGRSSGRWAAPILFAALAACSRQPEEQRRAGGGERAVPVRAEAASLASLDLVSEYPGELDADAAEIAPRISGRLLEVAVRIGERVERDQPIARIDDAEIRRQRADIDAQVRLATANRARAQAQLDLARRELERTEPLLEKKLVSEQDVDALRSRSSSHAAEVDVAEAQAEQGRAKLAVLAAELRDARVTAPFSGVIAARYLDPGAQVGPSTPIVRLVAADDLRVRFKVPEHELAGLREGLSIEVTTAATGKRRFAGKIVRLAGEISRAGRTLAVEAVLHEPDELLRAGMFAQVRLRRETIEDAVVVPAAALVTRVGGDGREITGVFEAVDGKAVWRSVAVRGREGDLIAVDGDIATGKLVLVLGHEDLADGASIRVVDGAAARAPSAQVEASQ
jgi:RND family efflux transporter MFP subunit